MRAVATGCVMGACDDAVMDQMKLPGMPSDTDVTLPSSRGGISRGQMLALMHPRPTRPPRPGAPWRKNDEGYTYRPQGGAVSSSQCRTLMRLARQARARNQRDN